MTQAQPIVGLTGSSGSRVKVGKLVCVCDWISAATHRGGLGICTMDGSNLHSLYMYSNAPREGGSTVHKSEIESTCHLIRP